MPALPYDKARDESVRIGLTEHLDAAKKYAETDDAFAVYLAVLEVLIDAPKKARVDLIRQVSFSRPKGEERDRTPAGALLARFFADSNDDRDALKIDDLVEEGAGYVGCSVLEKRFEDKALVYVVYDPLSDELTA